MFHSVKIVRRLLRNSISTSPTIYCQLAKRGQNGYRVVSKHTDLVIEGYPRSGNSYVEAAFLCSQKPGLKLSHHTHAAANVLKAQKLGKPCYVLIRSPADCAISLVLQEPDTQNLKLALTEYWTFYEAIEPIAPKICLVPFEVATKKFNTSLNHLNAIYGTNFAHLLDDLSYLDIMSRVNEISRTRGTVPDGVEPYSPFASDQTKADRKNKQGHLRSLLEAPIFAAKLVRCQAVYERLLSQTPL